MGLLRAPGLALAHGRARPVPPAAQMPMILMMVLYTCFGLWLLASPAIG